MTCTCLNNEVSETCLPDEWTGVNKKRPQIFGLTVKAVSSENCEHVAPPSHERFDFG